MRILRSLKDLDTKKAVFIYGNGSAGQNFLKIVKEFRKDLNVKGFVNSFSEGETDGVKVFRLSNLKNGELKDSLFLIASMSWRSIKKVLKDFGVANYCVIPPRFLVDSGYKRLLHEGIDPLNNYLMKPLFSEEDKIRYIEELESVEQLLDCSSEKDLFRLLWGKGIDSLGTHVEKLGNYYYNSSYEGQYYDFIKKDKIRNIIEGGLFDGDETSRFLKNYPQARLWGFEPFYSSFEEGAYVEEIRSSGRAEVIPKGLWSSPGSLKLEGSGLSASLSKNGVGEDIEVDSIDNFVNERNIGKVDFIKLDVEGAEYEVLNGAKNTIVEDRPQMAICLYHLKEDYFRIPLLLSEIVNNYKWHISHYRASFFETVWYGIPEEIF